MIWILIVFICAVVDSVMGGFCFAHGDLWVGIMDAIGSAFGYGWVGLVFGFRAAK